MKLKNGFTLIELLAVIVILAIIAVIAVPIVLNIIDESKDNATLRSADFYLDAVELSVAQVTLKNKNIPDGTYNIKDGNICLNDICTEILEVEANGEVPKSGTITITKGNITGLNIILDGKEITKNSKGELVYVKFLDDVCKPSKEQKYATNPYDEGYKYECKVDPNKDPYIFYVLNTRNKAGEIITESSSDKDVVLINLIMAQNVNSDGTPTAKAITETQKDDNDGIYNILKWINQTHYLEAGGTPTDWDNYKNLNIYGPITAMNFLSEATKNWTNTNEMIVDTFTDNAGATHNMKAYTIYARMPYYSEVSDVSTDKMWLIDYLSGEYDEEDGLEGRENGIDGIYWYWTLSSDAESSNSAWIVTCGGVMGSPNVNVDINSGVRPVITLNL